MYNIIPQSFNTVSIIIAARLTSSQGIFELHVRNTNLARVSRFQSIKFHTFLTRSQRYALYCDVALPLV